MTRVKRRAKRRVAQHDIGTSLRWWWSEKFKLPPNHPLFMQMDDIEVLELYYEDKCNRYQALVAASEKGTLDPDLIGELNAIQLELDDEWDGDDYDVITSYHDTSKILPYNKAYETGDPELNKIEAAAALCTDEGDILAAKLLSELPTGDK